MAPKKRKPKSPKKTPKKRRPLVYGPPTTSVHSLGTLSDSSLDIEPKLNALARGTDALVTRVINSAKEHARDPAEHLLDLSRAYYNEESAMGSRNIQCDRCLLKSPGMASHEAASRVAEAAGWVVTDDFDHCPVCKDGGLLLPGASTALAVQPSLTHVEMILVVRLRYIVDKIQKGASVEAFLRNAVSSQHRPMLSDLAIESNYRIQPLVDKATSLIERGVDVHPFLVSDPTRVWSFFLKLYALLEVEDRGAQPTP